MKRYFSRWWLPLGIVLLGVMAALWVSQSGGTWLVRLEHWNQVLDRAARYLLLWRLLLYGAIAWLWYRLDRIQPSAHSRMQWRRLGAISAALIIGIEISRAHLR